MSIRVMSQVWKASKNRGGALLVLLALADFSNDGGVAFPGVRTLAKKARLSARQVRRILRDLVHANELRIAVGKGPYGTNLYQVTTCQDDNLSGGTSDASGVDISYQEGVTPMSSNPSGGTTVSEPSKRDIPPTPLGGSDVNELINFITTEWNQIPGVVPVETVMGLVRKLLVSRIKEHPDREWWRGLFADRVKPSDFLCGGRTEWAATLNWVCKPQNLAKVLAGNYMNRKKRPFNDREVKTAQGAMNVANRYRQKEGGRQS